MILITSFLLLGVRNIKKEVYEMCFTFYIFLLLLFLLFLIFCLTRSMHPYAQNNNNPNNHATHISLM